jgi:hypothetical protein
MSDIPEYNAPLPHLASHPIFSGNVAILTGQNPKYPSSGDNNSLQNELRYHGYQFEPVKGQYQGVPEDSFLVKNPDPKVVAGMAKKLGQESILLGNGGQHKILYTNGENEGRYHAGTGTYGYHATQKPQDNYTHIPGIGYLRLNFDWDKTLPLENSNMPTQNATETQPNPEQASPTEVRKALGGLGKSLRGLLAKHEKAIEDLKAKEANGVQKLSKSAQGNGGELPGNVYNNPGVMQSGPVNKAMLGASPAPQTGAVGAMGKGEKKNVPAKKEKLVVRTNKEGRKVYRQSNSPNVHYGPEDYVVKKSDLPGAGTGVTSPDAGDYNQSMKMSEKCPTCNSDKTQPTHSGKGGTSFLKCNDCSRLFRGGGNKTPMKKSSEFTPECEGLGCQACGGNQVEHLGDLGSRSHFICKGCGMSFSHQKEEAPQFFNDSDLEPIAKSVYQAKCTHCGKEQEKQGAGRALEALTCSSCGKNGGLKPVETKSFRYHPMFSSGKMTLGKSLSPGAVKALAKSVADIRKSAGRLPDGSGFFTVTVGKKKVEKKEIPQVEPATDEIDMPGTKTIKNIKPKLIETDGSGSPTKGPDLKKKGMSPGVVKALAMKKDSMDPGSTGGGDLQKAGIFLHKPPAGSVISGHKVLPASTLPGTSQIPRVDRTAFLKGLVAKYGTKPVSERRSAVRQPVNNTGFSGNVGVTKAEYKPKKGPGEGWITTRNNPANKSPFAFSSYQVPKDVEAAKKKNTRAEFEASRVEKAEMGGIPKAPSASTVKAPTAAKVAAPGVKQSNPTAPKIGIKAPTTPKV